MTQKVISVSLSDEAKFRLNEIVDACGMKQKLALGRILEWFVRQEPLVRAMVLGQIPADDTGDLIDLLHQRRQLEAGKAPMSGVLGPAAVAERSQQHAEVRRRAQKRTASQTRRKQA